MFKNYIMKAQLITQIKNSTIEVGHKINAVTYTVMSWNKITPLQVSNHSHTFIFSIYIYIYIYSIYMTIEITIMKRASCSFVALLIDLSYNISYIFVPQN